MRICLAGDSRRASGCHAEAIKAFASDYGFGACICFSGRLLQWPAWLGTGHPGARLLKRSACGGVREGLVAVTDGVAPAAWQGLICQADHVVSLWIRLQPQRLVLELRLFCR